MGPRLGVVALIALVIAVVPATAGAATLRGRTAQHRATRIDVGTNGVPRKVVVSWRAHCQADPRATYTDTTAFPTPHASARTKRIIGGGTYRTRAGPGLRATITSRLVAHRHSVYLWTGSFRARAVIRRHGRLVDRCILRRVGWRASLVQAGLTTTSDPGDFIGGGLSASLDSLTSPDAGFSGTRHTVRAHMGDFTLNFNAPAGHRLHPGAFPDALLYPVTGSHPGIDITRGGGACNEVTGGFTIHAISFDRRGHVRSISIDFEQHCEGAAPALRGTLTARLP
jgi:hypothetical protein